MCLVAGSALSVNKICILFPRMMINLKMNPKEPVSEEDSVSISDWPETAYLAKLLSNNFRSSDRGRNPRHGVQNDPICLVQLSAYTRIYSKVEDSKSKNKRHVDTKYMND